jgi:hypothetical protein
MKLVSTSQVLDQLAPTQGTSLTASYERQIRGTVGKRKIMRIFLIGMLCGVMTAAAFTYAFAIPANSNYWRWEIWKRGGAAWIFDKDGHIGWHWMVDPIPDTPNTPKRAVVSPSAVKVRSEQL